MELNIISTGGFIFFLLIILIGYIFIEIIFGDKYFFRKIFTEYNNNLFDRIIHYIFWGIILNIAFFYLYFYSETIKIFIDFFNLLGKSAEGFKSFFGEGKDFQFIGFSIFYFINILLLLICFKILFFIFKKVIKFFLNFSFENDKIKKIKIKKTP